MRKERKQKKFGRIKPQRKALMKSLISSFILSESIISTETKIKAVRPKIEKLITHARNGSLSKIRLLRKSLTEPITQKLINQIAPRYKERGGGYTRIHKLPPRLSDGAKMAKIEFV